MQRWRGAVSVGSVFAITLLVFLPAVANQFLILDDATRISSNPGVLQGLGLPGLKWAFTCSMWHPLTWLSHQADVSLFGIAPAGHHFTSVLLHALSAAVLADLLRRTTGLVF